MHNSFKREVAANKYEVAESGIYLPASKVFIGGIFDVEHMREGELIHRQQSPNMIVNEGLNYILDTVFGGSASVATWYIGLSQSGETPAAGWTTGGTFFGTPSTAFDEAALQVYQEGTSASQSITNSANKATFTMNASVTIHGAFMVSNSQKTPIAGTLMAASLFAATRSVVDDDQLLITYTISASDA